MKVAFTSSLGMQNALRQTVNTSQTDLMKAQTEVSTGTYYDTGISLGYKSGSSVNLTLQKDQMNALVSSNSLVTQRLDASQSALSDMSTDVQNSLNALVALSGSEDSTQLSTTTKTLQSNLDALVSSGNTSLNGEYLFSGINTSQQPLSSYTDTSAAKATFDTAFQNYFGFLPSSAQTSGITVDGVPGMQDFIENKLEPMYDSASGADRWTNDWSSASDTAMTSRISTSETISSSSTANSSGIRKFALASVMGIELLNSGINSDVRTYVSKAAIGYMGDATSGISAQQGAVGLSQARVTSANTTLKTQIDIVTTSFNNLNQVDAYEASTKVNSLLSQLQASYSLTSQIQKLSLVNYL